MTLFNQSSRTHVFAICALLTSTLLAGCNVKSNTLEIDTALVTLTHPVNVYAPLPD
jgi:uncharacterized lipoprotein YajG